MSHKEGVGKKERILSEVKYVPSENGKNQELKPARTNRAHDTSYLYFVVLTGQLLIMVSGMATVWTSPALIILKSDDPHVNPLGRPITALEVSMLAGIPSLASLLGNLLPQLSDVVGRKKYLQIMACFILLSGIALAFSGQVEYFTLARCIQGIALNGAWAVVPIYVTEICEDHNRAKFGCFFGLIHQIGHFVCYIMGPIFSIKIFTLISTAPTILFVIFSCWIPESIFQLISKGKKRECKNALRKLRDNRTERELDDDLEELERSVNSKSESKSGNVLALLRKREHRVALFLGMLPLLVQHLSGVTVIMSFLAPLFDSAGTSLSGNYAAILASTVKMSCFLFTSLVVEKFGRRTMLLISSFGTCIPLFSVGLFFYLKHIDSPFIDYLQWLPLVGILSNIVTYSLGLGPIPVTIMSELVPTNLRAAASSFINVVVGLVIFGITASFPIISDTFGTHWCVWMFSTCCFVGGILLYFLFPEMEGKSFTEIQEILKQY